MLQSVVATKISRVNTIVPVIADPLAFKWASQVLEATRVYMEGDCLECIVARMLKTETIADLQKILIFVCSLGPQVY